MATNRIEVTGTVPDIRPYLARAAVFACPMRLGSGIKNKILQAWAMGTPVVATPESLGGLDAQDGVNLLVRETMADFADAVVGLLADPGRARAIGNGGRATVEEKFAWRCQAEALETLLQRVRTKEGRP